MYGNCCPVGDVVGGVPPKSNSDGFCVIFGISVIDDWLCSVDAGLALGIRCGVDPCNPKFEFGNKSINAIILFFNLL
jgi:hypothetical protein